MYDYNYLRELCQKEMRISSSVLDDFIVPYSSMIDRPGVQFEARIDRFKHIGQGMPQGWKGMLKSQYIVHQIFKENGAIRKYLNHATVKNLDADQQNYLQVMATRPWRFSFSEIKGNPAKDFFEMEDVFSGEKFLLYSGATSKIVAEHPVLLWFNLIGFNGSCWQTFGPVCGFQCFDADDIFFYSTELNDSIKSEADLIEDVENNPVPYMLLMTGAAYPLIHQGKFEVVQVIGQSGAANFNVQALRKKFRVEFAGGVFKLSHKLLSGPPHFAEAFYVEETGITVLSALTALGYMKLGKLLKANGFNPAYEPDIRVHLPMLSVIKLLLKKELELNPLGKLFNIDPSPENAEFFTKINALLALAMPIINAGKKLDVEALAKQAGVDTDTAKQVLQHTMDRVGQLRK